MADKALISKDRFIECVGRRKTSSARVRAFSAGRSDFTINDKKIDEYFPTEELRAIVQEPFSKLDVKEKLKISVIVRGGGIHSQAEAIRHGLTRVLVKIDETLRIPAKQAKFLTRDSRMKERRKFGLKKARRAPQWSKR
tara:strand:- start:1735 stop:2151 length:417 start_codon:yes stop_codon:yes gene_type:complete